MTGTGGDLIRHSLWLCHLPLKGKALRTEGTTVKLRTKSRIWRIANALRVMMVRMHFPARMVNPVSRLCVRIWVGE